MKYLFLSLLLLFSYVSFSQLPSQIQAKRGVFTDRLYLNDRWIYGISTNLNSLDSTSHNLLPSAKSVTDLVHGIPTVDWCNVAQYGADRTGTIDASAQMQALINSGLFKVIYLPAGTYWLKNTVQGRDSITIIGDGKSTVIKLTQNKPGFHLSDALGGKWSTLLNFTIAGIGGTDSTSQEGIRIDTCRGVYVNNVYFFKTASYGIHIYKDKVSTEANTILSCYFDSCKNAGIYTDFAEFNKIIGNTIAYCDTGIKNNSGNVTIDHNLITKGNIGVYLSGHAAASPGDFNDGHTEMTGNLIAHNFFAGLYCDGVTNGEQISNNIIRNNVGYDVFAQNSDNLWFDGCDLGVDSLVFVNCTNTNLYNNKIWIAATGRPAPPDQFLKWRIVGQAPTIFGPGYVANGISLYDVINNKRFDITHTNNVVDYSTTSAGRQRINDSVVVGGVISGSEFANGSLTLLGSDFEPLKSKIYLGTKSVLIDSVSANKEPMLGIGQNSYRGYMMDLQVKRRGIAWIHSENDSISTLSGAGLRLHNPQGHRADLWFADATFNNAGTLGDILYIQCPDGTGGIKIVATVGPIEWGASTIANTSVFMKLFNPSGDLTINSLTDNGHKLQVNGAVTINKDSVPIITSFGSNYLATIDTSTNQIGRISTTNAGITTFLRATLSWTPGSVSAASSTSTTVSLPGAAIGDPVVVTTSDGAGMANGEVYDAWVSSANVVTIRANNFSSGSSTYPARTFHIMDMKY